MENKNYYAVLMAGGIGSRFWPVSTTSFPKQFHDMLGTGSSLIQKTFARLSKTVPEENIFILTNSKYEDLVKEQLPNVTDRQIVLEPVMRNTAPCILLAALKIQKENPDALMLVAPSDHWIEDENAFNDNIRTAFDACQRQPILMTLGIEPTFANTGYGYINYIEDTSTPIKKVKHFTEKPNKELAKQFLADGNYLWNAGIFIWSANTIVEAFEKQMPDMHHLFFRGIDALNTERETKFLSRTYPKADNISIDFGIMENAADVRVLPATFDWNDLGTWGSLYEKLTKDFQNNAIVNAETFAPNSQGNMIHTQSNKAVVIDGLEDYIIVDRDDVLMIVPKEKEQDIKSISKSVQQKLGKNLN
ncbi:MULTISPECIES: mannose-1-phosphate guanylyltransferase [Croceibacter]|jgi:mannose-1-phosphate guanylyltransferase|uniref:mannose-1-phosphate guanylyltransferase n=1 Tax=Croceibacter atlanticus (strain ATCC BAA-628 / JCM 21780 / CIP 108009 / IAM 15332 / KCTC 12090 / HTCC2559) TaxID=216432 RepID=A3U7F9_CROAH|nr:MULTISPECIES: mannose-1-phosphate guanylyltransferase [Croceibacter]EAP88176.1 putative mannose-1-phosphate guanylyltransferase [Croceibacter atlanticus HTCC2559]MBG24612.1 mannose-1-phosphate guanylyltransferase [Croceibacter sp.]MBW4971512.1 mannose-1-phosphate guanylyltransferase [Croceibacter atlanticus]